jgi:hypothetical protein
MVVRGEPLTIIGNDNAELVLLNGCESNPDLPCLGVLANVREGFLNESENLERCGRGELVGHLVQSQACGNLVPLFKLIYIIL